MLPAILDESGLEQCLKVFSEPDIDAASRLDGDVMILGAGGKIGPSLAMRMTRAIQRARMKRRVFAVVPKNRFGIISGPSDRVEVVEADLLVLNGFHTLPALPNVMFMVGRKLAPKQDLFFTWATNDSAGRSL